VMLKQMSFLTRELSIFKTSMPLSHYAWTSDIITITQWLSSRHKNISSPAQLFQFIDEQSILDFFKSIIPHGKAFSLGIMHSCANYFYKQALPKKHISNHPDLFQLPDEDIEKIREWLGKEDFYARTAPKLGQYINRKKLSQKLQFDYTTIQNKAFSAFLRQFEPDLLLKNKALLVPASRLDTEYLSHRIPTMQDARTERMSRGSCRGLLDTFKSLSKMNRLLPGCAPNCSDVNWKKIETMIDRNAGPEALTPWIPLETSMKYLSESIRWITLYGHALVRFYLDAVQHFIDSGLFFKNGDSARSGEKKRRERDDWVVRNIPDCLKILNISKWTTCFIRGASNPFSELRNNPSVNDTLQIYFGAVAILIGTLKPIRVGELITLKRDCISSVHNDDWLMQANEKRGTEGLLPESSRPVPRVVGHAVAQLASFGNTLSELLLNLPGISYFGKRLFTAPNFGQNATPSIRQLTRSEIHTCMERFCDYVNLEPDAFGRRWYVRVHELRKSFLLNFFWNFRYAALDAASWIAGHRDSEQIYRYIQSNLAGEEIAELEAQYAAEQLWDYDKSGDRDVSNTTELYRSVCRHFRVRDINKVGESDLLNWLSHAFQSGLYAIRAYKVAGKDSAPTTVAFEVRRRRA
jgi:hypothetical protein